MNKKIIELKNVTKIYQTRYEILRVLDNINLSIEQGKFYGILGHSGCGKSSLLNIIGCIDKPSRGEIYIKERNVTSLNDGELSYFRNKEIGFIFQQYNLINKLTVERNMKLPLFYSREKNLKDCKIRELLDYVGLSRKNHSYPNELSGGEQQRVAIGRALVNNPSILLADEPTGNLDDENTFFIMELFRKLNRDLGLTVVMVTHNNELMKYFTDIITISQGLVKTCDTP